MNELQIFQNSEFGELGVLEQNGKPYFPATACARILGYANAKDAIIRHCKGVVKHDLPTSGGMQTLNLISEGDLYRLITHSKLPAAERFEAWVFDEVLPTIRRTGGYGDQMAGMNRLLEQLTEVTASLAQVAAAMAKPPEEPPADEDAPRRRRTHSIISRLDVSTRQEVEAMICSGQYTYSEIAKHLAGYGIKIGTSSVWRYVNSMNL